MKKHKIADYLCSKGIRPLDKRVRVMHYLVSKRNHPTVDMIYTNLAQDIPGLSKATVYNILKLFAEKNIVWTLSIDSNEARYDADTSIHGHFKCNVCNNIFDFCIEENSLPTTGLKGFYINESHYYLKGVCTFCKDNLSSLGVASKSSVTT